MGNIVVVGDAETLVGFRLGGIPEGFVEDAKTAVETLLNDGERVSVVIITEEKLRSLPKRLRQRAEQSVKPIFIDITCKTCSGTTEESLARKIKTTLGIDIPVEAEKTTA